MGNNKRNKFKLILLILSTIFFTSCSFLDVIGFPKTSSGLGGYFYKPKGYKFDEKIKGIFKIGTSIEFIDFKRGLGHYNLKMKGTYIHINVYGENKDLKLLGKGIITYKGKKYYFDNSNIEIDGYLKKIYIDKLGIDMTTKFEENDSFILELGKVKLVDRIIEMEPLIMEKTYLRTTDTATKAGTSTEYDWIGYPEDYVKKYPPRK